MLFIHPKNSDSPFVSHFHSHLFRLYWSLETWRSQVPLVDCVHDWRLTCCQHQGAGQMTRLLPPGPSTTPWWKRVRIQLKYILTGMSGHWSLLWFICPLYHAVICPLYHAVIYCPLYHSVIIWPTVPCCDFFALCTMMWFICPLWPCCDFFCPLYHALTYCLLYGSVIWCLLYDPVIYGPFCHVVIKSPLYIIGYSDMM